MPQEFQNLLQKPADEFEAPKPIPEGTFIHAIKGFKFGKSSEKKTPFVEFDLGVVEPLPDVNEEALKDWLGDETIDKKKVRGLTFYLTGDAMYRLGEFLVDHCGVQAGIPSGEQIQAAVGQQFAGTYSHSPSTRDPTKVFANLDSTAPVPT